MPDHEPVCVFCGRPWESQSGARPVLEVGHLNGNESEDAPDNLSWTCRPCNVEAAYTLRAFGVGRLTRQYNPSKAAGATSLGQWMQAVGSIAPKVDRGERGLVSDMSVSDAVAMIRATPHSRRSRFASELRSKISGRRSANPTRSNLFGFGKPKAERDFWVEGVGGFATKAAGLAAAQREANETGRRAEFRYKQGSSWHTKYLLPTKAAIKKLEPQKVSRFKGYEVFKDTDGEFYSSLDPSSRFDTAAQAKSHISWYLKGRGNPSKFDKCVADVESKGGARDPRAVCASAGVKKFGQREMTRRAIAGKRKAAKRNPAAGADAAFEEFHGRPADETVVIRKERHHHKHLASAGELKRLEVLGVDEKKHNITGFKGAILAFNEEKNQLFIEGGDQSVNLEDYGIREPHELETLGQVRSIAYFTTKDHLGEEGGTATYIHKFRTTNEDGKHITVRITRYPDLIYRLRDEQLEFSGGSYEIRAEGIDK